jgi:hypothetical protein
LHLRLDYLYALAHHRVADAVMRMAEPRAQADEAVDTMAFAQRVQTSGIPAGESGGFAAPPIVQEVLNSPGQPLDMATRAFMEPRFGADFSLPPARKHRLAC